MTPCLNSVTIRLTLALAIASATRPCRANAPAPRDADTILRDFAAATNPRPDPSKLNDPAYKAAHTQACERAAQRRGELALELYRSHPDHPRAGELLLAHWSTLAEGPEEERALREIDEFLAAHPDTPARAEILYYRALWTMYARANTPARSLAVAEAFLKAVPKDPRAPELLNMAASRAASPTERLKLYRRTATTYPDTPAGRLAVGKIRQAEGIGQPFDLSFADALTGQTVATAQLRGKVVVIDFWARSCPPCLADIPRLKALYERYHAVGVEFIGIPLDGVPDGQEAAVTRDLKDFTTRHQIPWPQYPPSRATDLATSWGVDGIPVLFVLDAQGRLHSTNARDNLEQLIPQFLPTRGDDDRRRPAPKP